MKSKLQAIANDNKVELTEGSNHFFMTPLADGLEAGDPSSDAILSEVMAVAPGAVFDDGGITIAKAA